MLFVVPFLALASNEPTELVVNMKNGTVYRFQLADKPVITFDSQYLYISSSEFSTQYENVERAYFLENTTTAVKTVNDELDPKFVLNFTDGHTVTINGCTMADRLAVYTVNGMNVNADVERTANSMVIDLGNNPKGIYIIRINSQSFKIQTR